MAGDLVKTDCPAWGALHQAVIKTDKNGRPYVYCAECGSQFITRNERQAEGLRSRFADGTVTVPSVTVAAKPEPIQTVQAVRDGEAAEETKTSPPPPRRSAWAPLIGS